MQQSPAISVGHVAQDVRGWSVMPGCTSPRGSYGRRRLASIRLCEHQSLLHEAECFQDPKEDSSAFYILYGFAKVLHQPGWVSQPCTASIQQEFHRSSSVQRQVTGWCHSESLPLSAEK